MRVLLAVCGSISFYKSFEILSELKKLGADVRIALSPGALKFVSPLAFNALASSVLANEADWSSERNHIAFSRDCDVLLIAPASANTINKLAAGIADDEFSSMLLAASDLPLIIAPAANARMLAGITEQNLAALKQRGAVIIEPLTKQLACKEIAKGALSDPIKIARICIHKASFNLRGLLNPAKMKDAFLEQNPPKLKDAFKIVITAGATSERIDEVRCLANFSSGKFGKELAKSAHLMGFTVVLLLAGAEDDEYIGFKQQGFKNSSELENLLDIHKDADLLISAAAVADFIPDAISGKIPRASLKDELIIKGKQAKDLLAASTIKHKVAFKLEPIYNNEAIKKAQEAMNKKGAFMCVLNTLDEIKFGAEQTCVHILKNNSCEDFKGSKDEAAKFILLKALDEITR